VALVVFLRGVNVGGHKTFQPTALVGELQHLGAINVGAAGTFILRSRCSAKTARAEVTSRLEFQAELFICRGEDILKLVARDPFEPGPSAGDARRLVSVLQSRPRTRPELPLDVPDSSSWQVRFIEVAGPFALAWWRRAEKRFLDPNATAEKIFGVRATTRNWNTIVRVASLLQPPVEGRSTNLRHTRPSPESR
jgi:uncharacterized protein (DUF1697 family)